MASSVAPLPHFPPEIWLAILESLPPLFFQKDIGRLTISKHWYSLAFPTFLARIQYTARVISRLVHQRTKRPDKAGALERARSTLQKTLRSLHISLDGMGPGGPTDKQCYNTAANLILFCLMLTKYEELRTVRFVAGWQTPTWKMSPWTPSYLPLRSIDPFLSLLTHINFLDLDLCGTEILNDDQRIPMPVHFCRFIPQLLSRLHGLRLRTRCICQEALFPRGNRPDIYSNIKLQKLTLDLYLGDVSDVNLKLNSTRSCVDSFPWKSPLDEMRTAMKKLHGKMAEPRSAQMVHLAPTGEVHVWDAATDSCVVDLTEKARSFPRIPNFTPPGCDSCFSADSQDVFNVAL